MMSRTFIRCVSDFNALTSSIMKLKYANIKFIQRLQNFNNLSLFLENGLRNFTHSTYTSFEYLLKNLRSSCSNFAGN